jgi:hypothetical protein
MQMENKNRSDLSNYFFGVNDGKVVEYYFLFSHGLSDTNISRFELIRLLEKIY